MCKTPRSRPRFREQLLGNALRGRPVPASVLDGDQISPAGRDVASIRTGRVYRTHVLWKAWQEVVTDAGLASR
jgi:hypothetical protein